MYIEKNVYLFILYIHNVCWKKSDKKKNDLQKKTYDLN